MEALYIYIVKCCGLILLFYSVYKLLLQNETFFNNNRWFLLLGLCTSVILPLLVYTNIIIINSKATTVVWSEVPLTNIVENQSFEISWHLTFIIVYCIGLIGFLTKFARDFYSLGLILKGKKLIKSDKFRFLDTTENVAPFSFFKTIVYNSSLYTNSELAAIIAHEKVHCKQNHTLDVLICRVFCIIFWFNPIIWLYKKAVLQNLEFIADAEASKRISDKKAYQFTLLKLTTHQNCVAITNHFYQPCVPAGRSLIKKRIVMLNKNLSKKQHSWKYAVVLPALVAFVLLFQIETVAQEKIVAIQKVESKQKNADQEDIYKINKNSTEKELQEIALAINTNYGIKVTYSRKKRNSNNELLAIRVALKKGKAISKVMAITASDPIKAFEIVVSKNDRGLLDVYFTAAARAINARQDGVVKPDPPLSLDTEYFINGVKATRSEVNLLSPNDIESVNVNKNQNIHEMRIFTKKQPKNVSSIEYEKNGEKNTVVLLNGKKVTSDADLSKIDPKEITVYELQKVKETSSNVEQSTTKNKVEVTKKLKEGNEIRQVINIHADNIQSIQHNKNSDYDKAVIIINDKISDFEGFKKLVPEEVKSFGMQSPKNLPEAAKADVVKKYGEKALNGIIIITTK